MEHTKGPWKVIRCEANLKGGGYHPSRCSRRFTLIEDGKGYCAQHAPSNIKASRTARLDKWDKQFAFKQKMWKHEELARKVLEHVESCDHEHCRQLLRAAH